MEFTIGEIMWNTHEKCFVQVKYNTDTQEYTVFKFGGKYPIHSPKEVNVKVENDT